MAIPWVTVGALSSFGSFVYTVMDDDVSNDQIIDHLNRIEDKVDEIIGNQFELIEAIHKLPYMTKRIVEHALVDNNYSYLKSHFSAFMELSSQRKRRKYVKRNFERIRELFEYVVDFEKRIDGQFKLISASEQMYIMMLESKYGILLMKKKFVEKIDEIEGFVEDIETNLGNHSHNLTHRYLKHRYIKSQNYTPSMQLEEFTIRWNTSQVRDCLNPREPDFKRAQVPDEESTWYCAPPNRVVEGIEFRDRFNRVRKKVEYVIVESIKETVNYEAHSALLDKVYRPYLDRMESHEEEYISKNLYAGELDDAIDLNEKGDGGIK